MHCKLVLRFGPRPKCAQSGPRIRETPEQRRDDEQAEIETKANKLVLWGNPMLQLPWEWVIENAHAPVGCGGYAKSQAA